MRTGRTNPTPPAKAAPAEPEPRLMAYSDYRQYLKDYYRWRKASNPAFSLRAFARKAHFPSHAHLQYVMEGKRNLSQKTLVKVVLALGLPAEQARYFENLVFFNQAESPDEKAFFYARLLESDPGQALKRLELAQLRLFETWYHSAVREMTYLKGFRGQKKWIGERLIPAITPAQAEDSLKLLLGAGFLKRTANGYAASDAAITTDDEVQSILVRSYHLEMMRLAMRAVDEVPAAERDISSVCFTVKSKDFPKLKRQIQLMRKQLRAFAAAPGEGERVVQVNFQLFPLARA